MTTVALSRVTPFDVRRLARLHRVAFPGYSLSLLGEELVVDLYRALLADDTAVSVTQCRGPWA